MKTGDQIMRWAFYVQWLFSAIASLVFSFIFAWVPLALFIRIFGATIWVAGVRHITEDYLFGYAFIPWFGIILGVVQYFLLRRKLAPGGWWILMTALGWSLAWLWMLLVYSPVGNIRLPGSIWLFTFVGIFIGGWMGVAQWLLLRGHVPHAVWWIPANILGFGTAGYLFGDISYPVQAFVALSMPSFCTGIVLWLWLDRSPHAAHPENGKDVSIIIS
jgi:hypothetical protein